MKGRGGQRASLSLHLSLESSHVQPQTDTPAPAQPGPPQVIIFFGAGGQVHVAAAPGMDRARLLLLLGAANMSVLQTQTPNGADAVIGGQEGIEVPNGDVQKQILGARPANGRQAKLPSFLASAG